MSSKALSSKTTLVVRRLYRNLLRTAESYTGRSTEAVVLTCLLHRSGIDDHIKDWNSFVANDSERKDRTAAAEDHDDDDVTDLQEIARDLTRSYGGGKGASSTPASGNRTYQRLFRRLLREVVTGPNGYQKMTFPSQADTARLRKVIRREFRSKNRGDGDGDDPDRKGATASSHFDDATRRQVAFAALRELNKKLSYYDWLKSNSPDPVPRQSARRVSPLPIHPPASYLRPGVFLVSHPYMHDSYFSKSVICILEHKGLGSVLENRRYAKRDDGDDDDDDDDDRADDGGGAADYGGDDDENERNRITRRTSRRTTPPGQTYGVIVNRASIDADTGEKRTLREVFREHMLPEGMADVFGDSVVREGGPVHVALQMIHSLPASSDDDDDDDIDIDIDAADLGGELIPAISDGDESPALYTDRATYFQGNMFKALSQVKSGGINKGYISFFVGASVWSPGQLAAEIAQGYWIPCRGPPEMALDGTCEHEPATSGEGPPLADLWLSMMSACGEDEAELSHLFHLDHWDENGMPCDSFDDDDDEDIVVF